MFSKNTPTPIPRRDTDVGTASVRPGALPWRRRDLLPLALWAALPWAHGAQLTVVHMWKGPNCYCCGDWAKHLESNGFVVKVSTTGLDQARAQLRMPLELTSCHIALIDGYAVEGHVPAREIRRLLRERPRAVGLTVPGMHLGSPGMDGPQYGGRKQPYDVLLVGLDGKTGVYQSYR
jgi:hypothetical protein